MGDKPTYEELQQRIQELESSLDCHRRENEPAPEQYRHLVENANEAIFVAQNFVFVYANPKAEELLGFSKRELAAKRLTDFIHEDDREMVEKRHARRIRGESPPTVYPFRVLCKSGEIKWVELKVGRFSWKNRPATVCFMTDISKRKKAEDFLKESKASVGKKLEAILSPESDLGNLNLRDIIDITKFQSLLNDFYHLTKIGIGIIDLNGNVLVKTDGWQEICKKFHRVHPESLKNCLESDIHLSQGLEKGECKIYRCKNHLWEVATPLSIAGKQLGNLFFGQFFFSDEILDYDLFRRQAEHYGFPEEEYMKALDQVPRWSQETVGLIIRFFSNFADLIGKLSYSNIQLARTMTKLQRTKEKAEASNKAKSEFLANMSHEIRTPLNGVMGILQLLQKSPLNDSQHRQIDLAFSSSKRLTALLNDILDLSRVEAGKMQVKREIFQLSEVMESAVSNCSPKAHEHGNTLKLEVDAKIPNKLIGDSVRLGQILLNLVGNACKFTNRGNVGLQACLLPASRSDTCRILFMISDNGIGIPDEKLHDVFNLFTQGDVLTSPYTRQYEGAGLGLPLVKRLIGIMNGTAAIETQEGSGTTFYISLPFMVPQEIRKEAGRKEHKIQTGCMQGLNILIVEDDLVTQFVVRELLEEEGGLVQVVENGEQALFELKKNHFDCVLMDVQMPVMDGVEATKRIRTSKKTFRKIPIIALTAFAMEQNIKAFKDAGMNDFISKPVEHGELLQIIQRNLLTSYR